MGINVNGLLQEFVERDASDLYLTVDAPPSLRFGSEIEACPMPALTEEDVRDTLQALISPELIEEFDSTLEYNTAVAWREGVRFRVNIFRQQQHTGVVLRRIRTAIPTIESLGLPRVYSDLIMEKRGLILVVGPTGSGKSTSLASMLEYRNTHGSGHIVTIEDPVEFTHKHRNCIITQRDIGIDTYSFGIALKNALRQTPDIIVIGEIRDKETMEHAIVFAETGHLCLATLHANNASQTIERIINFFPQERHHQVLSNLSFNLKAILSQRLLSGAQGGRSIAVEVLLNQGLVKSLIREGHVKELRDCIEKGHDVGMQSFDRALFQLCISGKISEEVALAESDNPSTLRLMIKQHEIGAAHAVPPRPQATGVNFVNKQQF